MVPLPLPPSALMVVVLLLLLLVVMLVLLPLLVLLVLLLGLLLLTPVLEQALMQTLRVALCLRDPRLDGESSNVMPWSG